MFQPAQRAQDKILIHLVDLEAFADVPKQCNRQASTQMLTKLFKAVENHVLTGIVYGQQCIVPEWKTNAVH